MRPIDFRSDTLTVPTAAMREAMYKAEVGDDGRLTSSGRGSDPTVRRLEDAGAELLGKEAALFCPSGTFGNLTAMLTHASRGDRVAVEPELHVVKTEKAAFMEQIGGLNMALYMRDETDMPQVASFGAACGQPGVRLACIENTHNYADGTCITLERSRELAGAAHAHSVPIHLDGARLFNAAVALGVEAHELAACADSVQFCLSKGLGAPVGSLLCGSREFIQAARDMRKLLGGGMRQAGVVAAAGLVALEHERHRLAEDHDNAQLLAEGLAGLPGVCVGRVQTNIVMLHAKGAHDAESLVKTFEAHGVIAGAASGATSTSKVRFVLYRGVSRADVQEAVRRIQQSFETLAR